jgi:hypothetical protein
VLDDYGFATLITARRRADAGACPVLVDHGADGPVRRSAMSPRPIRTRRCSGTPACSCSRARTATYRRTGTRAGAIGPTWNYVAVHLHGELERLDAWRTSARSSMR